MECRNYPFSKCNRVKSILLKDAGLKVSSIGLARGSLPNEGRIAILSSPQSGIRTLKELESKSVALSQNTHAEFVFDTFIEESSASLNKITKVRIPKIPLRLNLLLSDKVDAAVLPEPMATLAIDEGCFLLRDDSDENHSQIVLTAHDSFIDRESDNLHEFIAAYDQAVDLINSQPDKYRALFLRACSIPEKLENSYPIRKFSYMKPIPKDKFDKVANWLEKKQIVTNQVSFEDVYKDQFQNAPSS